jgi:AcrR family transcriptional regulator
LLRAVEVDRKIFEVLFRNKEGCFLAAFEHLVERAPRAFARCDRRHRDPQRRRLRARRPHRQGDPTPLHSLYAEALQLLATPYLDKAQLQELLSSSSPLPLGAGLRPNA